MKVSAWPFLISRNRDLDYRTIVIADFLQGSVLEHRLAAYLEIEPCTEPQHANLAGADSTMLSAIYRVVPASSRGEINKDSVGRTIYWIEGVIIRGPTARLRDETAALDAAHERVVDTYTAFWASGSRTLHFSKELVLEGDAEANVGVSQREHVPERRSHSDPRPTPPSRFGAGFGAICALGFALLLWLVFLSGPPDKAPVPQTKRPIQAETRKAHAGSASTLSSTGGSHGGSHSR